MATDDDHPEAAVRTMVMPPATIPTNATASLPALLPLRRAGAAAAAGPSGADAGVRATNDDAQVSKL